METESVDPSWIQRQGEEEDSGLHVGSSKGPARDTTGDLKGQYPQPWRAGASGQLYLEEDGACPCYLGGCAIPSIRGCPQHSPSRADPSIALSSAPPQLYPLPAASLCPWGVWGSPLVLEEMRGHLRGNAPKHHLVARPPGPLGRIPGVPGGGTQNLPQTSAHTWCSLPFPERHAAQPGDTWKEPGTGIGVLVSALPSAHPTTCVSVSCSAKSGPNLPTSLLPQMLLRHLGQTTPPRQERTTTPGSGSFPGEPHVSSFF